jgi:hypothetical protein
MYYRGNVPRTCGMCGAQFLTTRHKVLRGAGRYCSRRCASASVRPGPLAERFWAKVDKSGTCWLWTAYRNAKGYGVIKSPGDDGPTLLAHRVAWELTYGPIPAGVQILHQCDCPPCVRPEHLFRGTNADNVADRVRKGRNGPRPTPRGEASPDAKLREFQVREIRARYAAGGVTWRSLAREYGVSTGTVQKILEGRTWRHVA